jgi:hypothetical protein
MKPLRWMSVICVLFAVETIWAVEARPRVQAEPQGQAVSETRSPRETVAEFLRRIKRGIFRDTFDLTMRSPGTGWSPAFSRLADFDRIRPLHQLAADDYAMVVSNAYQGQNRTENFCAFLVKRNCTWLISRIMRVRPDEATWIIRGCLANPAVKADIIPAEVVGTWQASCFSTVTLAADGTGTELWVEPENQESDARPEPFTWKVQGSALIRQFTEHSEQLNITWVHGDFIRYSHDGGHGTWIRHTSNTSLAGALP